MKKPRAPKRFLRPRDAALALGVSVQTLRNWSRPGECLADAVVCLPSGQRRFDAAKVEALASAWRAA